ncbi:MAG: FAD-binding protein [Armatimonadetes bacterium]|nr:FAD-binding protein [Armatimonadota bacterium]
MARLMLVAFDPSEVALGHGFASALGIPFDVLLLSGADPAEIGAERTLAANLGDVPPADSIEDGVVAQLGGYSHIASVSSMRSKDHLPRWAAHLGAAMVTDVIVVEAENRFRRPIVAGSMIETVEVSGSPIVMTFRPSGFAKFSPNGTAAADSITIPITDRTRRVGASARGGARPDLTAAKVIVSGGRPLKDAETFERVIGGFADSVHGAAGATRAAVDSHIAPNELQVGQTGKIVAPDLYIAAGVSGSTQHMAGIKDSKTIVAVNIDPDAPIFENADLGMVGDLFVVLPELQAKLAGKF